MKTAMILTAALLATGCATTQYHPTSKQPTKEEACANVGRTFTDFHETLIGIADRCLANPPKSEACQVFAWGLLKMRETGIQEALIVCLKTGGLSEAQSRAGNHLLLIEQLTNRVKRQNKRVN